MMMCVRQARADAVDEASVAVEDAAATRLFEVQRRRTASERVGRLRVMWGAGCRRACIDGARPAQAGVEERIALVASEAAAATSERRAVRVRARALPCVCGRPTHAAARAGAQMRQSLRQSLLAADRAVTKEREQEIARARQVRARQVRARRVRARVRGGGGGT